MRNFEMYSEHFVQQYIKYSDYLIASSSSSNGPNSVIPSIYTYIGSCYC